MPLSWLPTLLFDKGFPSAQAQPSTLPHFLASYPLHDSYWLGAWTEPHAQSMLLLIHWDTFWCQDRLPFPGSQVADWPVLIIRLPQVYHTFLAGGKNSDYTGSISGAASSALTTQERNLWLETVTAQRKLRPTTGDYLLEPDLHHTLIEGDNAEATHIIHTPQAEFLCMYQDEIIPIPGLLPLSF